MLAIASCYCTHLASLQRCGSIWHFSREETVKETADHILSLSGHKCAFYTNQNHQKNSKLRFNNCVLQRHLLTLVDRTRFCELSFLGSKTMHLFCLIFFTIKLLKVVGLMCSPATTRTSSFH